jgi:hypothetical protein
LILFGQTTGNSQCSKHACVVSQLHRNNAHIISRYRHCSFPHQGPYRSEKALAGLRHASAQYHRIGIEDVDHVDDPDAESVGSLGKDLDCQRITDGSRARDVSSCGAIGPTGYDTDSTGGQTLAEDSANGGT